MEAYLYYAVCFIIGMAISRVFSPLFKNIFVGLMVSFVFGIIIITWINMTVMAPYLS